MGKTSTSERASRAAAGVLSRRSMLCVSGTALAVPVPAQQPSKMRLADTPGECVAFLAGDQHLFDYRYSATRPKTYVHPLFLPNGVPVTLDGTEDHIHHRGLMLAWTDVNGFDFWGETNPGVKGRIVHQSFERKDAGPPAELVAINHWIAGGKALLVERRVIRAPAPSAGNVFLDWESELRAPDAAVALNAERAVYDGLGIRFVYSMAGGSVLNANGTTDPDKAFGEPARWCAFHGVCALGTVGGAAIFDHPSNPRHPTPFAVYSTPHMGYISAAPTFKEHKLAIPAGKSLRFRYLVVTFLGRPDRARLDQLYEKWA